MNRTAVILAGGKGTRLKPFTNIIPKPLVPINNVPIIEIVIRQLIKHKFSKIFITLNYNSDLLIYYINKIKLKRAKIITFIEDQELGTAGSLSKLNFKNNNNFLVINSDILTDLNLENFYNFHIKNNSMLTVSTKTVSNKSEYGQIIAKDNKIIKFREKPLIKNIVSMGVYMMNKKILNYIPKNTNFGFDKLIKKIMSKNIEIDIFEHTGIWKDIGIFSDYEDAVKIYKKNTNKFFQ
jgi:NDP-mannose synthase